MPNPLRLAFPALVRLAAWVLAAAASAQCPPGAPMPTDLSLATTMVDGGPAHVRWQTAMTALAQRDFAGARQHLAAALEFHPASAQLLLDLALACDDDKDLAALWTERFVRAAADDKGKLKLDAATRKRASGSAAFSAELPPAQELTVARAAAIVELARFVQKQKPKAKQNATRALLVRWASELLLIAGDGAPAALQAVAAEVAATQAAFEPDYEVVYKGLAALLDRRPTPGGSSGTPLTGVPSDAAAVDDQRIRAARILAGLARQVAFKDLQGPRPEGPGKLADDARRVLADEHEADVAHGRIWSIAELEALSAPDAERFTEAHRHWRDPGLALSTTGRYRIETVCGYHTLLEAAKTVELHHARLVSHFGSDPFVQRQGVIRIVPESSDLETEGAPYWWAGGFQSGDVTTVRFAWGNIPGLGRTLTHELTHRFDGVLRPFLTSWYVEGHADWTGWHYGKMSDPVFVTNALNVGTVAHTYYKGYAGKQKFEQLLAGEIDDYRDNYFAGYSLYAFLSNYPPDRPRYREALAQFEKNARGGRKDAVAYFTATFCDGKQGRPASFDELHEQWHGFLRGCYDWLDRKREGNRWIEHYGDRGEGEGGPLVLDAPTWSWARQRAEPFYGQDHAAAATLLLHEVGDHEATIAAGVWSLTADGWRPEVAAALAQALVASKAADAAAAFGAVAREHFPQIAAEPAPALLAALPKSKALVTALAERTAALETAGRLRAADASRREHAELARLLGVPPLAASNAPPTAAAAAAPDRVPGHLGAHGFTESGLTDYEDRRHPGLWFVTPGGDVHVGREKPREATGVLDRTAHQRDAFVHTVAWQAPGHYVLRGRVHFTTSFVAGAIVFGHTRRDRDLRLAFSSGDFAYATGRSEQNDRQGRLSVRLLGLWERDDRLPDSWPSRTVELPEEQNWFEYAIHVRGPRVSIDINGEELLRYAVHDGTPIEGQVGFAMSTGAIRVQEPTVQRLDDAGAPPATGLDLQRQPTGELGELLMLPTRGIPLHEDGTLVLWLPSMDPEDGSPTDRIGRALRELSKLLQTPHDYPQQWILAVPHGLGEVERKAALAAVAELRPEPLPVVEHLVAAPFDGRYPWVLFVDAAGILRAAAPCNDPKLHTKVERWSRLFRQR